MGAHVALTARAAWHGPLSALLALVLCTSIVAGCRPDGAASPSGSPASAEPTATSGGTLRLAQAADAIALDPWNLRDPSSLEVTSQLFDTLVAYAPAGFGIVPRLATRWDVSPDGLVWSFVLREGVRFHDGTPLDAAAVVANFRRARATSDPLRPSGPVGEAFGPWAQYLGGFDDASTIAKVEARGALTFVLTTNVPYGPLLSVLALPEFAIVSPASMTADRDGFMLPSSRGVAGTGPFRFVPGSWDRGVQITLERNADYWDGGRALADRIVFRVIPDAAARAAELRAGRVDAIRDVAPADVAAIKSDPNLQTIARPAFGVALLGFGLGTRPFDDRAIRRAVAMALNRAAVAGAFPAANPAPLSQLLPAGMLGYDDTVVEFVKYDEAGAKKALADAGVVTPIITELWYPTRRSSDGGAEADLRRVADALAADLARIGFQVTVRTEDAVQYEADGLTGRFPLWLRTWTGATGDPDSYLAPLLDPVATAGAGARWVQPQAAALLVAARAQVDPSKRAELYKQVSRLAQVDVPRVPLFAFGAVLAASRKVSGLAPHAIGTESLAGVRVAR